MGVRRLIVAGLNAGQSDLAPSLLMQNRPPTAMIERLWIFPQSRRGAEGDYGWTI